MPTYLMLIALSDLSPRALVIFGALCIGLLAVFLRHKLG
jgi:hypothetical protein